MQIDNDIDQLITKFYNRHLVAQTNKYPSLFKYCDFNGGKQMLSALNVQFTRADSLNDEFEMNLSKTNIQTHIDKLEQIGIPEHLMSLKIEEARAFFGGIGICSCGKSAHNDALWDRYASNEGIEDGICIELDQGKVINHLLTKNIKIMTLLVNYYDNVSEILPWERFLGSTIEKQIFLSLLYTSKLKCKWAEEDEIRFIYSEPLPDKHFRPCLTSKCFKSVYFGKDMGKKQRIEIGQILNRHPLIKRYSSH